MADKFQNKYRIASTRLPCWDYGRRAAYFITICTQKRRHWFGAIRNGKMHLSGIGKIVEQEWVETPDIRPDMNLELGEFVVMPNHFHAIVIIGDNRYNGNDGRDAMRRVSTPAPIPPPIVTIPDHQKTANQFAPQSNNLASIVRGFKSAVTKNARYVQPNFAWQPRYHDHIIRNDTSFHNISRYIRNNPSQWQKDRFYDKTI